MRADAATPANYFPKARPPDNNIQFWDMLLDKQKEPTASISEWVELDLYEQSKLAVDKLVTEGDDTALKSLHHPYISG